MIGTDPIHWGRLAVVAEEVGFESVAVSDHVFYPSYLESRYPYTPDGVPQFSPDEDWPDVWVAISHMAAVTTRLRFMTNVYVLPLRNPFVVAKACVSAAVSRRLTTWVSKAQCQRFRVWLLQWKPCVWHRLVWKKAQASMSQVRSLA